MHSRRVPRLYWLTTTVHPNWSKLRDDADHCMRTEAPPVESRSNATGFTLSPPQGNLSSVMFEDQSIQRGFDHFVHLLEHHRLPVTRYES
jgi:hypothetical protein